MSDVIEPLEPRIAPAFAPVVDLGALNGSDGFRITGATDRDYVGSSVTAAGDINGDGFDDMIIGAYLADTSVPFSGAVYVIFGKEGGFGTSVNVSTLNGTNGFRISGVATYDYAGFSVDAAGDVNGDGFDDIVIGAYYSDLGGTDSGAAYVVYGRESGFAANLNLSALDGTNGFAIPGAAANQRLGTIVRGAGDLNGDGFADIVIGAPHTADGALLEAGAAYVIFGKDSPTSPVVQLSSLDGTNGFRLNGTSYGDHFGKAVAGRGDINGDGFDDLLICAPYADPIENSEGITYVVFGKDTDFAADMDAALITGADGFRFTGTRVGDNAGKSLAFADLNNDSYADAIMGGYGPTGDTGAVYVYYGHADPSPSTISLSTINGVNGFIITGVHPLGDFAAAISFAGDVNGDGIHDIIIGEPRGEVNEVMHGGAYVVFGKESSFGTSFSVASLDGTNGFWLKGIPNSYKVGASVGAGDIDGDGFTDLLVGAYKFPGDAPRVGTTFVVYAQPIPGGTEISVDDVEITEGAKGFKFANFTVSLSGTSATPVTVLYETSSGTALAGVDYIAIGSTLLTFAPGELSKTVSVQIAGDLQIEDSETFFLNLSGATNAVIANAQGMGTILNDDAFITISHGGKLVKLIDVDGDAITIRTTKGALTAENFVFSPDGALQTIDLLQNGKFTGANIAITAKTLGDGDGTVDVELLDATNVDLGNVKISGNLGRIVVGDGDGKKPALKSLSVGSLGTDEDIEEPLVSEFFGSLGKLTVRQDVRGAAVDVQGKLGTATIGGDLEGDLSSGAILLAAIAEGRSIDPRVSGGLPFGAFNCADVSKFTVKGSMNGGSLTSAADIGNVTVGVDLYSAAVAAAGRIKNVKVLGTLSGDDPTEPVVVAAMARTGSQKPAGAVAIDSLQVRGDVENAEILLGYQKLPPTDGPGRYVARNPDASSGKVVVGGDWIASNLVAGVFDTTGDGFGQNDAPIAGDTTTKIVSRIASIVIKGIATGSTDEGDHFAITAQQIGSLSIEGTKITLNPNGKDNLLLDEENGDFRLVEV